MVASLPFVNIYFSFVLQLLFQTPLTDPILLLHALGWVQQLCLLSVTNANNYGFIAKE